MTGLDDVPPLGLPQKIFVAFSQGTETTFFAETCTLVLRVPTDYTDFADFNEKFLEASKNATGYAGI